MAQNFTPDYNDPRLVAEKNETQAELDDLKVMEGEMLGGVEDKYKDLENATQAYGDKQIETATKQGELAIKRLEEQQKNTKKDYIKEQAGAYADWKKESNQYGVNAEQQAATGLAGSGFSESSQVRMYTAYQNRVAVARESFERAKVEYDIAIKDAQLQNNSLLAEIAFNTFKTKLELSIQGMQYKNQLLLDLANRKHQIKMDGYTRWKGVLDQINTENSLAEQARQYNETLAFQKSQAAQDNAIKQAQLALQREQFEYQKSKDSSGSGGGNGGGSIKKTTAKGAAAGAINAGEAAKKANSVSSFTGKTYKDAVSYAKKNGVPSSYASNIMTKGEWLRRKASFKQNGVGGTAVAVDTYSDYLKFQTKYLIQNYGGK